MLRFLLSSLALLVCVPDFGISEPRRSEAQAYISLGELSPGSRIELIRPELGRVRLQVLSVSPQVLPVAYLQAGAIIKRDLNLRLIKALLSVRRLEGTSSRQVELVQFPSGEFESIFLPFTVSSKKRQKPRLRQYEFSIQRGTATARVRRVRSRNVVNSARLCPVISYPALTTDERSTFRTSPLESQSTYTVSMYLDVDSRFYGVYGEDTAAVVALVLFRVNTIYMSQLDIELRLTGQTIFTDAASDPYAPSFSTSQALLSELQTQRSAETSDVKHLFTSQRGFTDAVGLAYLGVVCFDPTFAMGWSDFASGFNNFVSTVAHELGHNFGAGHDLQNPDSIMGVSGTSDADPRFSNTSVSAIGSHISAHNSCLLTSEGDTISDPGDSTFPLEDTDPANIRVSIKLSKIGKSGYISGTVKSVVNGKLSGRVIELRRFKDIALLKTAFSASTGRYKFKVRPRGQYFTVDRLTQKTSKKSVKF